MKSMRNVELKHVDALLRHLGLIKAKLLTLKREDPFMAKIQEDFKQPLTGKLRENLDKLCHHMRPEIILGEYFLFITYNQLKAKFRYTNDVIYHDCYQK